MSNHSTMWLPWILLFIVHLFACLVNASDEGASRDAAFHQGLHPVDARYPPIRAGIRRLLSAEGLDSTGETFQTLQECGALGMWLILSSSHTKLYKSKIWFDTASSNNCLCIQEWFEPSLFQLKSWILFSYSLIWYWGKIWKEEGKYGINLSSGKMTTANKALHFVNHIWPWSHLWHGQ